jgi:hypothetical protein
VAGSLTGGISLYDKHGERLHTVYVGAAPAYGKEVFSKQMEREIEHINSPYNEPCELDHKARVLVRSMTGTAANYKGRFR